MNNEELQNAWSEIYETILSFDSIDRSQASALLARLQPQAMSEDFLMLTADNDFIRNFMEQHYADYIKQALLKRYNRNYTLSFEIDPSQQSSSFPPIQAKDETSSSTLTQTTSESYETTPQPVQSEQGFSQEKPNIRTNEALLKNLTEDLQNDTNNEVYDVILETPESAAQKSANNGIAMPTSSLTFENFVIGASNQMAYSMAVAVAENPGRPMLNPLFIYGKSGLGKTHLMRAIQNHIMATRPDLKTAYVDSADFLNGYVEATRAHDKEKSSFKNFKNTYQEADVLLIDDIQYLQGKEQTLDIVFQIFNFMVDQGKQVVLSADRAPKNISIDERYQSRFNSGGTFDIQPPEVETKLGIIKSFVNEYNSTNGGQEFHLSDEISRHIAENSSSNIRELKSAVTKVIFAMTSFGNSDITVEEVSKLLENHFSGGAMKKLSITDIQKVVESYYDIPHADLIGQKRMRKIVYARQIAVYLCRDMLGLPFDFIAKSFGGRDHTTIMYNVSNIEEKLKKNREVAEEIENIKRQIKEM